MKKSIVDGGNGEKGHCPWREKLALKGRKKENNAKSNSSKLMILHT